MKRSQAHFSGRARRGFLAQIAALSMLVSCDRKKSPRQSRVGELLPDFSLVDLTGQSLNFGTVRNNPLALNFWATWCSPCREEMAGLERAYQALKPRGLRMIGIAVDEDINLIREYLLKEQISFPVYRDPKAQITGQLLGTSALPMTVLVGTDGRIRHIVLGARRWDESPTRQMLEALLA